MSCCCGAKTESGKKLSIEYLYLDLNTCERCVGTDAVLDEVVEVLRPALELAGYEVDYQKHEMETAQMAEQYHFISSPTIRVNGRDIFGEVYESECDCCSDIAGTDVDCRVFQYQGETYTVPTKEMLASAILSHLDSQPACSCETYVLPENLKRFYDGKAKKNEESCCCGGSAPAETECCCHNTPADPMSSIKVLGSGCKSCHELYENTKTAVENMGLSMEVEYVTDLAKVMGYGVMSMPGLVVNEKVVSMGKVLKAADVEKLLHKLGY